MKAKHIACHLLTFLMLSMLTVRAEPGHGPPLGITTGTVRRVSTVAQLEAAVDAVNAAGVPATILVADGTYVLDIPLLHILCPGLIIRGESGNRDAVVIRGPDEGPDAAATHIFLVPASNVTIADMTFGYCRYHGVQIQGESPNDASGTRIHNCRIVNCNEQFIKGSSSDGDPVGATDGIIEYCLFEFTGGWAYQYYTGGIDIHKAVNWTVRDNLFRNIRTAADAGGIAEHAIHFWKRCPVRPQNLVVERNRIVNCDRGIGFGLTNLDGGLNGGASIIRNNMIYNDGTGVNTDCGIGLEYACNVAIDNNTVVVPSYWAPIEYRFAGSSNLVFRNNLTDKGIQRRDGAPAAAANNNLTSIQTDWFHDITLGDLHLTPRANAAIGHGLSLDTFNDDIDGQRRPYQGAWDVGADEYMPGWAAAPPPDTAGFDARPVPTRKLYAATDGSDATGDGSRDRPYATLAHAAGQATPGTAVILLPGTYPGGDSIEGLAGTADAPIWLGGDTVTNRPVLNGGGEGLHLSRVAYVVVRNLEVNGATGNGINCDDGGQYARTGATHHVVFRNLYIHDIGGTGNQDGLKLSGVNRYWVLNSEFTRCGGDASGSGIDHVGCHDGVIANCHFHELSANAVQCKGGSARIDILACRLVDAGQRGINLGGSTGFTYFRPPLTLGIPNAEARDIRVLANVFRGSITPVAYVGCVDCLVANNTIVDPEDWFLRILQETVSTADYTFRPAGDCTFMNNLVYFERARLKAPDVNVGANTAPDTFTFANNLWYAYDAPADSAPDLPAIEANGMTGRNPLLANPATHDYTVTIESPATRAGIDTGLGYTDAAGSRYLRPPTIGAYEISGDRDHDAMSDAWELRYFGTTNATNGGTSEDADGDGFRDIAEFVAGTNPTNPASRLVVTERLAADKVELRWPSVAGRTYAVYAAPRPTGLALLAGDLPATPDENAFSAPMTDRDTFYRVSVRSD